QARDEGDGHLESPSEPRQTEEPAAVLALFVGELSCTSGADLLVECASSARRAGSDGRFLVVGDGSLRSELEASVQAAGIGAHCRLLGELPDGRLEHWLSACDLVVLPARVPQDSTVARCAIGLGKPVLTTHFARLD